MSPSFETILIGYLVIAFVASSAGIATGGEVGDSLVFGFGLPFIFGLGGLFLARDAVASRVGGTDG